MVSQMFTTACVKGLGLVAIAAIASVSTAPAHAESCSKSMTSQTSLQNSVAQSKPATSGQNIPIQQAATTGTVVDIAAGNSSFTTLVQAVKAAGLVDVLSGKGPFTVFAPTNKAFAALPKGTVEMLLKPENKAKLIKVLTYHVVPGSVLSTSLSTGSVKTVEGSPVAIKVMGKKVMVNNANVTGADIKATNGVIHVIDKVILPPNL